jgi:predicted nucleic acid-binding protein
VIAADTSVWIDHFNAVESAEVGVLHDLIEADAEVAIVEVCLTEILQGFRRDRDVELVASRLLAFPILRLDELADYFRAAELYRTARRSGRTVRSTIDCLIASVCIREDTALLHRDRDFDELARCTPLKVVAA